MLLWLSFALIASVYSSNKVCPDGSSSCPDFATCCELSDKRYGCCPLENAVCCDDHIHCCPEKTKCEGGECFALSGLNVTAKKLSSKQDFAKYLSLNKYNNVTNVFCPNSSAQCPNGYTCCKLLSDDWGCCPFVNAMCCNDHLHCCPQNMQCDSTSQACSQGLVSVPSALKELSVHVNADIICPDNSTCAESMTCCKLNSERFGCCAYPNAVCCEDHSHCCPHDFICDVVEKQCRPKYKSLFHIMSKYYKKMG